MVTSCKDIPDEARIQAVSVEFDAEGKSLKRSYDSIFKLDRYHRPFNGVPTRSQKTQELKFLPTVGRMSNINYWRQNVLMKEAVPEHS